MAKTEPVRQAVEAPAKLTSPDRATPPGRTKAATIALEDRGMRGRRAKDEAYRREASRYGPRNPRRG